MQYLVTYHYRGTCELEVEAPDVDTADEQATEIFYQLLANNDLDIDIVSVEIDEDINP